MSELTKYEAYKKKLEGICDENELVAYLEPRGAAGETI